MNAKALFIFFMLTALPVNASSVYAENGLAPRGVALTQGMPVAEVLKLWGAPQEREERETKRQELWRYGNSEVLFQNGRVISWLGVSSRTAIEEPVVQIPAAAPSRKQPRPLKEETVTEILSELKGYGSSSPGFPSDPNMGQSFPRPTPMGMYPGRADMNMPPN